MLSSSLSLWRLPLLRASAVAVGGRRTAVQYKVPTRDIRFVLDEVCSPVVKRGKEEGGRERERERERERDRDRDRDRDRERDRETLTHKVREREL